jgi:orotidine-5'-phosphate decarboxylase
MKNEQLFHHRNTGLILAADVITLSDLDELLQLAAITPAVMAVKVGFTLALRFGLRHVVQHIRSKREIPVIYDHQKAATDIPEMGPPFAKACRDCGVDAVIFFPQAGPRTLEAFVAAAFQEEILPIIGLVMTHSAYLASEGGFIVDNAPDRIFEIGLKLGVSSYVLPGTKPDLVERFALRLSREKLDATVMMPGIGTQGGTVQKAFRAAGLVRRLAIVGSSIYQARNPEEALLRIASQIDL